RRAAQKLNLSSSPHRRRRSGDENIGSDELPIFPNGYAALLLKSPPPAPPALLRRIGVKELTGVGKSERILRELNAVGSQEFRRSVVHGVVLHERDARYVLRRASPSGIKAGDCAVA
ncbi:KI26B protein, partial [Acromyrmex insinuator]